MCAREIHYFRNLTQRKRGRGNDSPPFFFHLDLNVQMDQNLKMLSPGLLSASSRKKDSPESISIRDRNEIYEYSTYSEVM